MEIDPIIFFDLVIALFVLSIAVSVLAVSYSVILRKLVSHQKKFDDLVIQINQKEADLLASSRKTGAEIIEDATKKAQGIISDSQNLNSESRKLLDESLQTLIKHQTSYFEKASQDFLEEYKKELNSLKENSVKIAQNTSKAIEEDTKREIEDFDNVLARETFASQKIVEEKIEDDYAKAQKEVQDYKNEMLKKIDSRIYKILENISKAAIGRSIPLAQHEKLIIEALEKAKKDGLGN